MDFDLDKLPPLLLVCNCAGCGKLLATRKKGWHNKLPPLMRGKIKDRPYCGECLSEIPLGSRDPVLQAMEDKS